MPDLETGLDEDTMCRRRAGRAILELNDGTSGYSIRTHARREAATFLVSLSFKATIAIFRPTQQIA